MLSKPHIYILTSTHLINSIKHEHSCNALVIPPPGEGRRDRGLVPGFYLCDVQAVVGECGGFVFMPKSADYSCGFEF